MNQHGSKSASDQPVNSACNACRTHKVRCLPNPSGSSRICQRCAKTGKTCVYTAPQKRKQRKRTDTRVAELEREVQAMRALFGRTSNSGSPAIAASTSQTPSICNGPNFDTLNISSQSEDSPKEPPSWMEEPNEPYPQEWIPPPFSPGKDVIDRGILSMNTARQLFHSYNEELIQHYPAVVFPAELTADELRTTKPTLFLAVIAAASAKTDSQLYSILNSEVLSNYARRTVISGEKSLELVQAMIITSIWYMAPGKFAQLKFYEYIHMATTMALDIGLGVNPKGSRRRGLTLDEPLDHEELERRRTFLVCYLVATGVSISMRRPNMLRWSAWLGECLESIENHSQASKWDNLLAAWVHLLKITEETGTTFAFDDVSNMARLSEPRSQIAMIGLQKSAEAMRRDLPREIFNNSALNLQYHYTQLYIHEIALHDDHVPDDFQPPFSLSKLLSVHVDPAASNSYIDAISTITSSAQAILDILLHMNLEAIRALPIQNFVRACYAIFVLVKIYISSKSPSSKIGAVIEPSSLKLDIYLKATIDKLAKAVGRKECRAPFTFLGMLMRLHGWYKGQEKDRFFIPPSISTGADECWLPPIPRALWDPDLKDPSPSNEIPFGPRHPEWQPYSIPLGEFETLDFGEGQDMDVDVGGSVAFDEALSNLRYENLGDVDRFLRIGDGYSHIAGDSWSLTEDILAPGFVYNPNSVQLDWMVDGLVHSSI